VQHRQLAISDAFARTLAMYWQDVYNPQAPITVLAATGAITAEAEHALRHDLSILERATANVDTPVPVVAQAQLSALLAYVEISGLRGPVQGWAELSDAHAESWTRLYPALQAGPPSAENAPEHNGHGTAPEPEPAPAPAPAAAEPPVSPPAHLTLYEQLGGGRALGDLVEIFYRTALADPALAHYFQGIDVHRVKAHQYAFLTSATGGPDYYVGRSLRKAHASLAITPEHFDRIVEHLVASLAGVGVGQEVISAIVAKVTPHRNEVASFP
jgi:hemoglobin